MKVLLLAGVVLMLQQSDAMQKMSFKPPELTDETQWSNHVPSTLNCEGCKAIAFNVNKKFWAFHQNKYPKNEVKPESDVAIAVEEICSSDTFSGYGVKNVNGHTKLSGPGLRTDEEAGMIMGGGKWPNRLSARCQELLGEFDEHNVYEMIVKAKGKEKKVFNLLCTGGAKHYKLNSCGNGFDKLLDPESWKESVGNSMTTKPVRQMPDGTYEEIGGDDDEDDDDRDEL